MKYYLIIIFCGILASTSAQDCNETMLAQKPGIWKPGMKGSENVPAADLAREKTVVATLHNMVKSNLTLLGIEANFHGGYSPVYPEMPANSYDYSIIPLNFYCTGNTIKTEHETSTQFEIAANTFVAEIYDTLSGDDVSGTGFHFIPDMPVAKDGYWYFREKDVTLAFGIPGKSSAWLVTYEGKLPFAYVTKKEFLEKRKRFLLKGLQQAQASLQETLKNNEAEKARREIEFKNDPEKLKKYLEKDYQGIKNRFEKLLAESDKPFKNAQEKIETALKESAAELNQPAIVKVDPHDYLSFLFTEDSDAFGQVLIKPNPGYFRKLPRSSPQFFYIALGGDHNNQITARFMDDIMKAVDFTVLKNMLGK